MLLSYFLSFFFSFFLPLPLLPSFLCNCCLALYFILCLLSLNISSQIPPTFSLFLNLSFSNTAACTPNNLPQNPLACTHRHTQTHTDTHRQTEGSVSTHGNSPSRAPCLWRPADSVLLAFPSLEDQPMRSLAGGHRPPSVVSGRVSKHQQACPSVCVCPRGNKPNRVARNCGRGSGGRKERRDRGGNGR